MKILARIAGFFCFWVLGLFRDRPSSTCRYCCCQYRHDEPVVGKIVCETFTLDGELLERFECDPDSEEDMAKFEGWANFSDEAKDEMWNHQ